MRSKARIGGIVVLVLVAAAVLGAVVMVLWNAVLPALFTNVRPLDYPHALGLLILCRILFGGLRGHHGWHGHRNWRKWHAMTPEEREQFLRNGPWGRGPQAAERID
jgi:hypothetical protein